MKRFSVCGLALLMLVALVATTTVRADEDSKKLLNLNLPKISLKKSVLQATLFLKISPIEI